MTAMISGMLVMAYIVVAVFFLRFYRESRDRLFLFFATSFGLLAVQRFGLAFTTAGTTESTVLYLLRLLAFTLIAIGIIDKNRR